MCKRLRIILRDSATLVSGRRFRTGCRCGFSPIRRCLSPYVVVVFAFVSSQVREFLRTCNVQKKKKDNNNIIINKYKYLKNSIGLRALSPVTYSHGAAWRDPLPLCSPRPTVYTPVSLDVDSSRSFILIYNTNTIYTYVHKRACRIRTSMLIT